MTIPKLILDGEGIIAHGGGSPPVEGDIAVFGGSGTITVNGKGNQITLGGIFTRSLVFQPTMTLEGTGDLGVVAKEIGSKEFQIESNSFSGNLFLGEAGDYLSPVDVTLTLADGFVGNQLHIGLNGLYNLKGSQRFSKVFIDSKSIAPGTYSFQDLSSEGFADFFIDNGGSITVTQSPEVQ